MVFFLIQLFLLTSIISIISHFIFQCTPACKKFFENANKSSFKTTENLFGAHNKKVAKEITAVRPATCTSMQPEIIQPVESVRTKKEEDIAKGKVFTKKDNHPTFEDINDDWEPSIEEVAKTAITTIGKSSGRNQTWLFKPPKPETSYTKTPMTAQPLEAVKKQISDNKLPVEVTLQSSKLNNKSDNKRPQPSKFARTLREEEIARGERKTISLNEEPTLEEILDDWG